MTNFDIFGQIGKEIQEFNDTKILIAGKEGDENARYLSKSKKKGYMFNQAETLDLIDLYYNSIFEKGELDSEGQRKLFLNICAFRADVASKMIDIDTKDFIFVPEEIDYKWTAYFISREFEQWAKENYFGELLNEFVEMFPKYGTVVSKTVGKTIERIPLKNLVNQQDAKSLKTAKYVIEIHRNMSLSDMKKYPDWDTENVDLDFGQTADVYERYGEIPLWYYNKLKGINTKVDDDETIQAVVITTLAKKEKSDEHTGTVLFCEKVDERPYEECHWKKQDGRWLGIGEIENQFENQIARNMIANLRRRALLWSSKKIFQSPDDNVAQNLIRDVKDGQVLRIMPNGNITQIDMASREVGEFQSTEQIWEDNSNQKSFTYEVATGESMPSGTPFRMGVVLSNAVMSHFGLKKEKLGLFLKRVVLEQVFEIFKKENRKEHKYLVFTGEKGADNLKKAVAELHFNKKIKEIMMSDKPMPNLEVLRTEIEDKIKDKDILEFVIPDGVYDEAKVKLKLNITGEDMDVGTKITTLTTIYQELSRKGDPRADTILDRIMALTGDNLEAMIGAQAAAQQQLPAGEAPSMNELAMANAPEAQQAL
jgi:hypothetical protein